MKRVFQVRPRAHTGTACRPRGRDQNQSCARSCGGAGAECACPAAAAPCLRVRPSAAPPATRFVPPSSVHPPNQPQEIVFQRTLPWMVRRQYLVPPVGYRVLTDADLSLVPTKGTHGDFKEGQAGPWDSRPLPAVSGGCGGPMGGLGAAVAARCRQVLQRAPYATPDSTVTFHSACRLPFDSQLTKLAFPQLEEAVNTPQRNELAVRAYRQLGAGRPAIVFCVGVQVRLAPALPLSRPARRSRGAWRGRLPRPSSRCPAPAPAAPAHSTRKTWRRPSQRRG